MNDNRPPARRVPIIGVVGLDGRVTITDPRRRPAPRHPALRLVHDRGDSAPVPPAPR